MARYSVVDIVAIAFCVVAVVGSFLPWGDADGGLFDQTQSVFAVFIAGTGLLTFLVVPLPMARKVTGLILGALLGLVCWMAVDDIRNEEREFLFPSQGEKTIQAGLWTTMVAAAGLFLASVVLSTKDRALSVAASTGSLGGTRPAPAPVGAWELESTPEPLGPAPAASSALGQRVKCPQCGTRLSRYGRQAAACGNCGFQP